MSYQIQTTVTGEKNATVDDFIREVADANREMNESWATIKAQLPSDQQGPAEAKVRQVLKEV